MGVIADGGGNRSIGASSPLTGLSVSDKGLAWAPEEVEFPGEQGALCWGQSCRYPWCLPAVYSKGELETHCTVHTLLAGTVVSSPGSWLALIPAQVGVHLAELCTVNNLVLSAAAARGRGQGWF